MEADVANEKQGVLNITMGALLGVLALLAYLFLGSRNETLEVQKLLTAKVEQFASTQIKLDSISNVLDAKIIEVRQLGGSVTELERIKRQLIIDKKRLKYDLTFSMQQYSLKIRDYKNFLAQNEANVHALKAENGSLLSQTRALEEEKESILSENTGLKYERAALAKAVVDYSLKNADLTNKVTLASAMKAINVEVMAVADNGKERRGGTYKASRIDRLKIDFVLLANPLASATSKDVYVRILDANGAVVSESGIGGVMLFDGHELGYSTHQTVPFDGDDQRVDILFRREAPYRPGTYTVELYTEGSRIGDAHFVVK
ncbi:hypothetical protein [Spirosoma radiotolerans]|uniref:Chromosome segregation protein SMC n=1 Tax=Spirosoma radiotolerans TaxID=1379870 RepID=A0A0E3ZW69_9BACT|nr:hypothetical protein [Spirosoma radiotolerans]AKD55515.1 hypothetical protein SD10_11990 [Spirosoma radiotolerans]